MFLDFVQLFSFFSRSPKRQHVLQEFQVFLNAEINKILRPAITRWLSLELSVTRIDEQWEVLQLYFTDALLVENIERAREISDYLNFKYKS